MVLGALAVQLHAHVNQLCFDRAGEPALLSPVSPAGRCAVDRIRSAPGRDHPDHICHAARVKLLYAPQPHGNRPHL